jgi:co-chaperonin GroES (HSP10)
MPLDAARTIPSLADVMGVAYTKRIEDAWPDIPPTYRPLGKMVVFQLRTPGAFRELPGGKKIWLPDETKDREKHNVQTAVVRALGPVAYKRRDNLEPFPEGEWCKPGDFVRVPKYGGDRTSVKIPGDEFGREAFFVTVTDTDVIGFVDGDPLAINDIL